VKKKAPQIHVGTSGWSYPHWKENFYPPGLKTSEWLTYYSKVFSTVEVNTTFYHTPLLSTVEKWNAQVGTDFFFSIKAHSYMTHRKKLHDCQDSLQFFYKSIQKLDSKMGPILFQLPPSFKLNKERLIEFIHLLSDDYKYTFEFRHSSWFIDEIYELLSKNDIALCITDLNGKLSPEEITSSFTYIRLHGPQMAYTGSYGPAELKSWKTKINNWMASNKSVYCYFDNDEKGYAVEDAKALKSMF
jgi:uncharacterized protein YecE (DUF72 family)